jgi:hypothetical protein
MAAAGVNTRVTSHYSVSLLEEANTPVARVVSRDFVLEADAILVSLYAEQLVSGTLQVRLFTVGKQGQELEVITFPPITGPTANLILRRSAVVMSNMRLEVSHPAGCTYSVVARGITALPDPAASEPTLQVPSITNTTLAVAGTEYTLPLPAGTKSFLLRSRGYSRLRIGYGINSTNTAWMEVSPGCSYRENGLGGTTTNIYVQSNSAGEVVELLSWT